MPSEAVKADIKINGDKISTPIEGVEATYAFDGVYGADVKTVSLYSLHPRRSMYV